MGLLISLCECDSCLLESPGIDCFLDLPVLIAAKGVWAFVKCHFYGTIAY